MSTLLTGILGILLIVAVFIPTVLIFLSGVRYRRTTGGLSSHAIFVGALLLTLLTFDIFYPLILTLAFKMDAERLAEATIFLAYAKPVVTYIALLLIGIGMWAQSKNLKDT